MRWNVLALVRINILAGGAYERICGLHRRAVIAQFLL